MLRKASSELHADEVLIDLEDAVAAAMKGEVTRTRAVWAVRDLDWGERSVAVRVNAVGTGECLDDIRAVVLGAGARIDAIVVPKVESEAQVQFVDLALTELERSLGLERRIGLEALIETALGLVAIERIAAASDRLEALIFGPGDFAASLGIPQLSVGATEADYPGDQWHYALARVVTTARAYGLQAIDGPFGAIADGDGFRASARRSALLGFDGKWAVHPSQIPLCHEVYSPSPEQLADARTLLAVYERASVVDGQGAVMHDGEMIDEASRRMAEAIVARADATRS